MSTQVTQCDRCGVNVEPETAYATPELTFCFRCARDGDCAPSVHHLSEPTGTVLIDSRGGPIRFAA